MWSSNAYLKRWKKLKEAGFPLSPQWAPACFPACGLGIREFYCLSETKLVSIFPDTLGVKAEHREHFFRIPDFQQLVNAISKLGYDIESFTFREQRTWQVSLRRMDNATIVERSDNDLLCALADAYLEVSAART